MRWAGERAFLVELGSLEEAMAFHARVTADQLGQREQIAAARTVLLSFATAHGARRAAHRVAGVDLSPLPAAERRTIEIEVVYDGEDLGVVAELTGLSREAVVAAHQSREWTAAFGGFAPGFAYLVGGDPRLRVPRRASPRTAVPVGSVALAAEFSAVYPRASPGGWRLIGHTDAALWDLSREDPALVVPGDGVRFRAVRASARAAVAAEPIRPRRVRDAAVEVAQPGLLSLIEDLGRHGQGDLGVTASGAADTASARAANRLVGNSRQAALVETLGGLVLRAATDVIAAVTGADPAARIRRAPAAADGPAPDERPAPLGAPFLLRAGDELALGYPESGLRSYVAVRGGIAAPLVLGSRSRDVLGGVGPDPLRAGDAFALAGDVAGPVADPLPAPAPAAEPATLHIRFGPRDDAFDPGERAHLTRTTWIVGPETDRVGARLAPVSGTRPLRAAETELASEGVVTGALQVPPSGEPVLFGADHPVTGGYPVIAVVVDADLPRAAQLRPGERVRFLEIDPESSNRLTVA